MERLYLVTVAGSAAECLTELSRMATSQGLPDVLNTIFYGRPVVLEVLPRFIEAIAAKDLALVPTQR